MSGGMQFGAFTGEPQTGRCVPAISGARRRLRSLPLPTAVLSEESAERADGIDQDLRARGCGGVSQENGDGGESGSLPAAGRGGGISQRVDQGEVRLAKVPRARSGEGGKRVTVGLPDLQHHAMEANEMARTGGSV